MAVTEKDIRRVVVSLTKQEIISMLGGKALELEIIDFTPDRIEIQKSSIVGKSFDITFEVDTFAGGSLNG